MYYEKRDKSTNQSSTQSSNFVKSEVLKFASQVALMLVVLMFYDGSNVVQRYRYDLFGAKMLYDNHLVGLDESLLGWLCPRGQLALCLDSHPLIGVSTTFGAIAAEILQLMYVSYYFWGNGLGVWLALEYFYGVIIKNKDNTPKNRRIHWRRIQMFVCAWVGGFLLNFIINMIFPAVSPRIHLSSHYKNEIRGFFFADTLRSMIAGAAAKTFSAFPSGHCGLSWLVPILAHRMKYKRFTQITIVAAILITMATLFLRYHYFVDFLFSTVVIAFASWFGGFHTQAAYDESLLGDDADRMPKRKRTYDLEEGRAGEDSDDDMVPLMDININTKDQTSTEPLRQALNQSNNQRSDSVDRNDEPQSPLPATNAAMVRLTSQSNVSRQQTADHN